MKRAELWEEFVVWLATPAHERGSVSTEEEWATAHDTTTRTLRRWKQDPKFVEMQEAYGKRLEARRASENSAPAADGPEGDEGSYLKVKAKLIEGAASGNPKYMDLYFKTYGKPFVEEEAAARTTDLVSMDIEELIVSTVVALGDEVLAGQLRRLGWVAVPPSKEADDGQ